MKTRTSLTCLFASLGAASLVALSATAQTPAPSTTTTAAPAPTASAPVTLPYGVEDVLKLTRAQVSEDVILTFIHNSGTIYSLAPKDIVYLHNEGVTDRVIGAMLDQRKSVPAEMAAQTAPATTPIAPQAPVYPDANAAAAAQVAAQQQQYAPTYTQPAPAYVQPDATYTPPSTVYTIPYSAPAYPYYYGGYPYYYGGYPYYYGPTIGFGFGFGYGGYGYGGYRGGGYRGGGYRGGFGGGGHPGYGGHR